MTPKVIKQLSKWRPKGVQGPVLEAIGPGWAPWGWNDWFLKSKGCPKGAKRVPKLIKKAIKNGVGKWAVSLTGFWMHVEAFLIPKWCQNESNQHPQTKRYSKTANSAILLCLPIQNHGSDPSKGSQNRCQNDQKTMPKPDTQKGYQKERFGSHLGPFWEPKSTQKLARNQTNNRVKNWRG